MGCGRRWLFVGVLIGLASGERAAFAQEAQAVAPKDGVVVTIDSASLERIREALARPSAIRTALPSPRFYALTLAKPTTFADQMKNWDLSLTKTVSPGTPRAFPLMFSIDLLNLLHRAAEAHRRHETRQIRERIDRELGALGGELPR